jgi:flavin reductase (DIM6/NTAB) family NADH-FMN oxidoreductase RutF
LNRYVPPQPLLRDGFSNLVGPVCIIVSGPPGAAFGTTVSSVASVSISPPVLSFSIGKNGRLFRVVSKREPMGLTVLTGEQVELARACSAPSRKHIDERLLVRAPNRAPSLMFGLSHFNIRVRELVEVGERLLVLASVEALSVFKGQPLFYHCRKYLAMRKGKEIGVL